MKLYVGLAASSRTNFHNDAWAKPLGSLNAAINTPVTVASPAQTKYGKPIHTPPTSRPFDRSHPRNGELTSPIMLSIIAMVVFNVATVCGSTTAFNKALQSVGNPTPRLLTTSALMNSHAVGANAVRKLPPMTKMREIRAKSKSLSNGPNPRLFTSTQEPAGKNTRRTAAAVIVLTVET
jgi:hypothetical protein